MGRGDMGTPLGTGCVPAVTLGVSSVGAEGPSPGPPHRDLGAVGEGGGGHPSMAIRDVTVGTRAGPLSPARLGGDSTRMGHGASPPDLLLRSHP